MDNRDKANAAFAKKHIVLWLRAMFLLAFLALIAAGLRDGFGGLVWWQRILFPLPFLALITAGIIEAFLKPARP